MTNPQAHPLPANTEVERDVLGSMILDNRLIDQALGIIPQAAMPLPAKVKTIHKRETPEPLFFSTANQMIFEAILALRGAANSQGEQCGVNLTLLAEELLVRRQLEPIGGAPYLATLEDGIFSLTLFAQTVDILVAKWRLRAMLRLNTDALADIADGVEPAEAMALMDMRKDALTVAKASAAKSAGEIVTDILIDFHRSVAGETVFCGVTTGFARLDNLLGGLTPGNLVIVAARPSVGKSAFALNMADQISVGRKIPTVFASVEMAGKDVTERLLAARSGVSLQKIQGKRRCGKLEADQVDEAAIFIGNAPLLIDACPGINEVELLNRARRWKAQQPRLAAIFVDYIQLMRSARRRDSRQAEVSDISMMLKQIAGELDLCVVALSQLSREIEKRGPREREPRMSDLRDSGQIEQDADVIAFLCREKESSEAKLKVLKHRGGPLGEIELRYQGDITLFAEAGI